MTTQVPPSALLPLNPEQLARLQAATTDLTPTQLAWVSGYFWGVLNQQPAALAATPAPAAEMPGITIISASQTGNARRVAEALRDDLLAAIGKLTAEYGRIGNNLNQIARHLNEWRSPYPAMAKELQDAAADLATLKFEVMKKVGDAVGNVQAYKL